MIENANAQNRTLQYIATDRIFQHPDNPRKNLGDLTELADSIRHSGVMQNLTVVSNRISQAEYEKLLDSCEGHPTDYQRHMLNHGLEDSYTVVIGHRRLAAAKLVGLSELPCVVVEMSYQEQVATMMTENLQRVDLTPYEQAQGFRQLTADFGMSIDDVAEKTGFSSSTVRRRLKLCDLDGDIFRKVSDDESRQISMGDLERLSEIEDEKTRNIVLASIGTRNFENELRKALNAQENEKNDKKWREALEQREGFQELRDYYGSEYVFEKIIMLEDDPAVLDELPDGMHFWSILGSSLYIKKKREEKNGKEVEKKEAEKQKRQEAYSRVKEAFRRAYDLRKSFVEKMKEKDAKTHLLDALVMAYEATKCHAEPNILYDFCNLNGYGEEHLDQMGDYPDWYDIATQTKAGSSKIIMYWLYSCCDDGPMDCTCSIMNDNYGKYLPESRDRDRLTVIYRGLERMGYQMSDEEAALMDGTSPLYYREAQKQTEPEPETEPEQEQEPETEPDPEEEKQEDGTQVQTRFQAFKSMGSVELERELGDMDNVRQEMKLAILECNTAEDVAIEVEGWFCTERNCSNGVNCKKCIEEWLNDPYEEETRDDRN